MRVISFFLTLHSYVTIHKEMDKKEKYDNLLLKVKGLMAGDEDWVGKLANVSAAIHDETLNKILHLFNIFFLLSHIDFMPIFAPSNKRQ